MDRWYISKSAIAKAVAKIAPGQHPTPEAIYWLERLCWCATRRLPQVPRESTRYPERISRGYKQALVKAIKQACCKPDYRFL